MTLTIAVGLLLVAAIVRAQQQTKTLGLRLGSQQYENQNWQLLEQAVCLHAGGLTPCTIGGTGSLIQAATAPFACSATTGGLYIDTDCAQVCRCNPGQAAWCRSDTGGCLSATDCCVSTTPTTTTTTLVTTTTTTTTLAPTTTTTTTSTTTTSTTTTTTTSTTTTTTTSSTTTTTAATGAAPSWVPSMLAVWLMEEAGNTTTRVNAQGTTSRNLTVHGSVAQDTTVKIEGIASAKATTGNWLETTDATLEHLATPFTCLGWITTDLPGGVWEFGVGPLSAKGFEIKGVGSGAPQPFRLTIFGASNVTLDTPSIAHNVWSHLGVTMSGTTANLYLNGALTQTATATYTAPTGTDTFFMLGGGGGSTWVDEGVCAGQALNDAAICRICSCGIRGEQCTCTGTAYTSTGRNASACGSCTLPADCTQATP